LHIKSEIEKLEFENINQKIEDIMNDNYKQTLIIEPEENFIKNFEAKIFEIKNSPNEKFTIRDLFKNHIRKLSKFSINVTLKDMNKLMPNLKQINGLRLARLIFIVPSVALKKIRIWILRTRYLTNVLKRSDHWHACELLRYL